MSATVPTGYPVATTIIGSKAHHVVELPGGRKAHLTVETVPDDEPYPYRGYRNTGGYVGDLLARMEESDRERYDQSCRDEADRLAGLRRAQAELVAKFASGDVKPRRGTMTPKLDTTPFKVAYTRTPWEPKPFGMGDWVVIDADGRTGQVSGEILGQLWATATGPDGRTRDYCANREPKTGAWERDGFRWTRSTDVRAAEHDIAVGDQPASA